MSSAIRPNTSRHPRCQWAPAGSLNMKWPLTQQLAPPAAALCPHSTLARRRPLRPQQCLHRRRQSSRPCPVRRQRQFSRTGSNSSSNKPCPAHRRRRSCSRSNSSRSQLCLSSVPRPARWSWPSLGRIMKGSSTTCPTHRPAASATAAAAAAAAATVRTAPARPPWTRARWSGRSTRSSKCLDKPYRPCMALTLAMVHGWAKEFFLTDDHFCIAIAKFQTATLNLLIVDLVVGTYSVLRPVWSMMHRRLAVYALAPHAWLSTRRRRGKQSTCASGASWPRSGVEYRGQPPRIARGLR